MRCAVEGQVEGLDEHIFNFATRPALCCFGQLNDVEVLGISIMFAYLYFADGLPFLTAKKDV